MSRLIIQFSTSLEWQSAIIRKLCHSPFSHCDIVLPDGNLLGASDQSEKSPILQGNRHGVAIRPPDYQLFGIRRQMLLETDLAASIIDRMLTQLGKPFDSSALHAFLDDKPFDRAWRDPEAWFCSELVVWAMEGEGFWPHPIQWAKSRISPMDLYLIETVDVRFVNRDVFWDPVPGLVLGKHEV